jgi:hypothetical protein
VAKKYLLLLWLGLPSFLMVLLTLSSLAASLLLTAVLLGLGCLVSSNPAHAGLQSIKIRGTYLVLLMLAGVSAICANLFFNQPLSAKQGFSFFALLILFVFSHIIFTQFFSAPAAELEKNIRFSYKVLLGLGVLGIVLPFRIGPYAELNYPVFPFSEPSHFALAYLQVTAMMMPISGRRARYAIIAASGLLAVGFPNTTLLIAALLLLLLVASTLELIVASALLVPIVLSLSQISDTLASYFSERLTSDGSENISRLVYIQGWEAIYSALSTTSGWGIGFQNLGNEPPGAATYALSLLVPDELNRADGSFLLAKTGGEFGFVGLFLCAATIIFSFWMGYRVRRALKNKKSTAQGFLLIPACSSYVLIVEMLIRGPGYFSPSLLLAMYLMPLAVMGTKRYHRFIVQRRLRLMREG